MSNPVKVAATLMVGVGLFLAGYGASRLGRAGATQEGHALQTCPMHPQYTSTVPGDCPICGMRLVAAALAGAGAAAGGTPVVAGTVDASPAAQQLAGIRTTEVRSAPVAQVVRVPGQVVVDEQRLHRVIAAVDGWIRELGPNPPGTFVRKDQRLATYYTPSLVAATQTYIFALQTNEHAEAGAATINYQRGTTTLSLLTAIDSLRSMGMSDRQIKDLERTRVAPTDVHVYSPAEGFVLARGVSPGQRFDKGTELYKIADIGHVWILADFFERDRALLSPGARATVRHQGHAYEARMADALPQFDPQSRTLRTRFEVPNPRFELRPDMFVDVELEVTRPDALTVPADAVVDTGARRTVYVETGPGRFEPRAVETGWRLGERVQITRGLAPGERVVESGTFLVDSESRMRAPSQAPPVAPPQRDPVCGMIVDPSGPGVLSSSVGGRTIHFCSKQCKSAYDADPAKYTPASRGAHEGAGPT